MASCEATTKKSAPCKSTALRPDVGDPRFCIAHQPEDVKDARGFGGAQLGAGRPRSPRPLELARSIVEDNARELLRPYLRTLGKDLDADGRLVDCAEHDGAVLVGRDKEGNVFASDLEDLGAKINAVERLLDRVYGKPRQALEHTGDGGGPIEFDAGSVDLGKLSDDDLTQLEAINAKLQGDG